MPLITVRHTTVYRYRQPVALGEHRIMFRPRDSYDQQLLEAKIEISPEPADLRWVHDVFGNCVAIARFSRRTRGAQLRQHDLPEPFSDQCVGVHHGRSCPDISLLL